MKGRGDPSRLIKATTSHMAGRPYGMKIKSPEPVGFGTWISSFSLKPWQVPRMRA